jgi:glycerol uptake facilitator-like aquaporin
MEVIYFDGVVDFGRINPAVTLGTATGNIQDTIFQRHHAINGR